MNTESVFRKISTLAIIAVACVAMTACSAEGNTVTLDTQSNDSGTAVEVAKDAVELKMGFPVPQTGTWGAAAEKFAEILLEKTNGKYVISMYPNDELSGGSQVGGIEMLQQGATDIYLQDCLIWSSIEQKLAAPAFPWLMPSEEIADEVMSGEGGELVKQLISESGAVCIGIGENGYRQVVNTKKAIENPEDLTGLKIRVPGISMYVSLFKVLGADPVTMNASERYTALQQGAIDGCENPLELHITQKDAEVVKYCTIWNYSYDPVFLCVSENVWGQLSDEEKTAFNEAGQEAMEFMKQELRSSESNYRDQMEKEYGITFTDLTEEQMEVFREKAVPVYEEFRDTLGEDVFNSFGYTFE